MIFKNMSKELQNKTALARIEHKAAGDDGSLHITAYALAFGNVDSWGDIILPTACDAFLKSEDFGRMALCYQHDKSEVIGVITGAEVDSVGLKIEADILPTATGKDVQTLIRGGAIKEFSIGYYADEYHYEKRVGYQYDIRVLDAITIVEVSPVTRAANANAILLDAKNDKPEEVEVKVEEPINEEVKEEINPLKKANMEKKMEGMEQELKTAQTELKAAQDKIDEQATEINNLDASLKEVSAELKAMKKAEKPATFADNLKSALEENKDKIEKLFEEKRGGSSIRMEVKTTVAGVGAQAYGTAVDTVVGAAPHITRAFLGAFGEEIVNGAQAAWLDGSFTNNADYVDELVAAKDSAANANEVIRQFGKIATRLLLSSELKDWMTEIYNWAQGEALEFVNDKIDAEVWGGAGADTSAATKKKIYGLKSQATAFSKVATYANANIGDVILDAIAQAKKNGYVANVVILPFAAEALLKGVKDVNGNYLYNQLTGMFAGVRVLPSASIGATEMLIADSRCAKVLRRPSIEVEITRDADLDGWKVNVRKSAQTKVKTPHKKGLIYVSDYTAAITAITQA